MIKTKSNEWILNNWRGSQKYKVRKKKDELKGELGWWKKEIMRESWEKNPEEKIEWIPIKGKKKKRKEKKVGSTLNLKQRGCTRKRIFEKERREINGVRGRKQKGSETEGPKG